MTRPLPAPSLGHAGWGVPNPDDPAGDWLSDGWDEPEEATAAAELAREHLAQGRSAIQARVLAARAIEGAALAAGPREEI